MVGISSRKALITALLAGAVAVGGAAAQPPDITDAEAILQWADDVDVNPQTSGDVPGAWEPLGATEAGLLMGGVTGVKDESGMAKVGMRLELFEPMDAGGGVQVLSQAEVYEVNCAEATMRPASSAYFSGRNLTNTIVTQPAEGDWSPVSGSDLETYATAACGGGVPAAPATAARTLEPREFTSWVSNNVQTSVAGSTWQLAGQIPGAAILRRDTVDRANSTAPMTPRVLMRLEYFDPTPGPNGSTMRSMMIDYDLNCTRNQARRVRNTAHPQNNFSGVAVLEELNEEFVPVAEHPLLNSVARDVCREVEPERRFQNR